MKMTKFRKALSLILCILLIAAIALATNGCKDNKSTSPAADASSSAQDVTVLGEGKTTFNFTVVDADENSKEFEIHTDKTTVGDALLELGLIEGEDSEFGLYVKTVNGITVDFNADGKYWAFYINDEYAMTGVDATDIEEGASYSFVVSE